jgi:lipoprotein
MRQNKYLLQATAICACFGAVCNKL